MYCRRVTTSGCQTIIHPRRADFRHAMTDDFFQDVWSASSGLAKPRCQITAHFGRPGDALLHYRRHQMDVPRKTIYGVTFDWRTEADILEGVIPFQLDVSHTLWNLHYPT